MLCKDLSLGEMDSNPPAESYSSSESLLSALVHLPRESTKKFPKIHKQYLRSRGFPPQKIQGLIKKYRLRACHTEPFKYKFRIIIPVIEKRKVVSFTTRTIDDMVEPKYKEASTKVYKKDGELFQECAIQPKHLVYNIDSIQEGEDAILVEGPIDVWKMGSNTICFFGINCTEQQVIIIKRKKIKNLYVMFDNDKTGIRESRKVALMLAPLVKNVEIITLQGIADPGKLMEEEAILIKNQLGIK